MSTKKHKKRNQDQIIIFDWLTDSGIGVNLEYQGVEAVDLVISEGLQRALIYQLNGNIDLMRVEALLQAQGERIPFGMITVTNNTGGGQPVISMPKPRCPRCRCSTTRPGRCAMHSTWKAASAA